MLRARDPEGSTGLKDASTCAQPGNGERMILFNALRFVPMRLVNRGTTAAVAGKSSVRQKIGGIGEDQIYALGGQLRKNSYAISLVEVKAWPSGEGSQLAGPTRLLQSCFRSRQQFRA